MAIFEIIFEFIFRIIFEILLYGIGCFVLRILTGGRYPPKFDEASWGIIWFVELVGLVTVGGILWGLFWGISKI